MARKFPPLDREFYNRSVVEVAQALLGKQLLRSLDGLLLRGRIVEAEAYLAANDPACHAARGRTRRNASMFGPPGHAYVYSIHSRYCLNAVTEPEGVSSAVLIRALEPLEGIEVMQQQRGRERLLELTRGPGRLCEAFGIDRKMDGWDLTRGRQLWIGEDPLFDPAAQKIRTTTRIGVTSAHELLLRFVLEGNRFASRGVRTYGERGTSVP